MKYMCISVLVVLLTVSVVSFARESDIHVTGQTTMQVYGDDDDGTPREDKAEVNIKAPTKVKVGDMIVIDLSESLGGGFDYKVDPTPPGLRTFDDGKIIVCGTGSKNVTYTFMVSCALDGDSDIGVQKIKVTGAAAPGPSPNPGENLVEKVKDWAEDVESPTKKEDALGLARSFSTVAALIDEGTFTTSKELLLGAKASNRDALGENISNWIPFTQELILELKTMSQHGLLSKVIDHAKVWREVAQGLREYANTL